MANAVHRFKEIIRLNKLKGYRDTLMLFCGAFLALSAPLVAAAGEAMIPDLFVSMAQEDRPAYALVVEKGSQQLTLFKYDGKHADEGVTMTVYEEGDQSTYTRYAHILGWSITTLF